MNGVESFQAFLKKHGHYSGAIDGAWGTKSEEAAQSFELSRGSELPWMTAARGVIGLHEVRNNAELKAWLKSDGSRVGDPKQLPWCGDFAETAAKIGLPGEPFPGAVGANPYFARNWTAFGVRVEATYGCVLVFERGSQSGHVGFAVGHNDSSFFVLGGNQGNSVSVVPVAKERLLAARWPSSSARWQSPFLPRLSSLQAISTNER